MSELSAARPPEGANSPSGGSDPHEVGERGGTRSFDVAVVGFGPAGAVAAALLGQAGL
jgi:hypothetical protein